MTGVLNPRLRSPGGPELNLRSQLLHLDYVDYQGIDVLRAVIAGHMRYVHEHGHWTRLHGTSLGVLLTLLRRTRDRLVGHVITGLDDRDIRDFARQRLNDRRLFDPAERHPRRRLGEVVSARREQWLDLYRAAHFLFDARDSAGLGSFTPQSIEHAIDVTWHQSEGDGMLPRGRADAFSWAPGSPVDTGAFGSLSTRLLLECASVLDEWFQLQGPLRDTLPPDLARMVQFALAEDYGLAYRAAWVAADRDLGPAVVQTLIDFALNPPLPDLTPAPPIRRGISCTHHGGS